MEELEKEIKELKTEIKALTRQFQRFTQALDETRRRVNLPEVFWDPQVLAINARANERAL
jgi:archaellum component FlaC